MRIYEYAKKRKVSSKEILEVLEGGGFDFASHMAMLTPEAMEFLEKGEKEKRGEPEKKKPVQKQALEKKIKKEEKVEEKEVAKKLVIRPMVLSDAAQEMGQPVTAVILVLLKWGIVANINQVLAEDVVQRLAEYFEVEFEAALEKKRVETFEKKAVVEGKELQERLPVVVVMGHVDHGKTTLLDFIRRTRVASRERGGITQHLGAYEVEVPGKGRIVFLDTPGHEAFSKIRMRGSRVADIAVLVVAADDGIMPQTVEAINHAKFMGLPIVVAINKIDRASSSQIEAVKQQLVKHELLPEDWGGDVVCVPISAKLGQGIDHLLEMILLQSQIMELKADTGIAAQGYVLESKLEKGRGPVATLICQHGVAKIGDFFICGDTQGRISSFVDSFGRRVKFVEPSVPVLVAGFDELPEAGDFFEVVSQQEYKKSRTGRREKGPTSPKMLVVGTEKDINIIVKTDSDSSKEALLWAIEKLSKKLEKGSVGKRFKIIHAAVGDVSESDIDLAAISGALLVGLHVKLEAKASLLAQRLSVKIKLYDIIYKLVEYLEEYAATKKEIKKEKVKVGEAVVLRVFNIKKIGVIAGCLVKDGRFSKDGSVVIYRDNKKIGEGKIRSLQREKKVVKEVHSGFECGFLVDGFDAWEVDDRVECYLEVAEKK